MSRVVQGLLGIFGPVTLIVKSCRISQDIPSYPRTVILSGRASQEVPSCPRTSWDLWTWEFGSRIL